MTAQRRKMMVIAWENFEKVINLNEDLPSLLTILSSKDIYIPISGFIFLIVLTYLLRKKFYKK